MRKIVFLFLISFLIFGLVDSSQAIAKKVDKTKTAAPVEIVSTPAPAHPSGPVRAGFFTEAGLAGGAGIVELGYSKSLSNKILLSGALGYAVGNGYGIVVLDPARVAYNLGVVTVGAGLNYAMYSALVSNIPGISGTLANKNMFGVEVFASRNFGRLIGRVAYGTALGVRAGVGYMF